MGSGFNITRSFHQIILITGIILTEKMEGGTPLGGGGGIHLGREKLHLDGG